jgi:hypothetical protein
MTMAHFHYIDKKQSFTTLMERDSCGLTGVRFTKPATTQLWYVATFEDGTVKVFFLLSFLFHCLVKFQKIFDKIFDMP